MDDYIVVLPEAKQDVRDGAAFYDDAEPGVGEQFRNAVVETIDGLLPHWRKHREHVVNVRMAIARPFPFGVFFTRRGSAVVVVAVFDLRQEPERCIRRLIGRL